MLDHWQIRLRVTNYEFPSLPCQRVKSCDSKNIKSIKLPSITTITTTTTT